MVLPGGETVISEMNLTLLLDLDGTLLDTKMDRFIPAYFQALADEFQSIVPSEVLIRALIAGTNRMNESDDFFSTLEQVFSEEFYSKINVPRADLEESIGHFYDRVFPTLSHLTERIAASKPFIEWASSQGFRLAIATDPLFPRKATHHRLRWAGFEPEQFELVSSFEHFHFSKTRPAYYAEMLGRLGWPEGPVLMAGNDYHRDILPARSLGLPVYHVQSTPDATRQSGVPTGDLEGLRSWIEMQDARNLLPEYRSKDSVMSILIATPAILSGLTVNRSSDAWSMKPFLQEWSMGELVCHLRDTEREIHHMQLDLFDKEGDPFIPRPDTSVWASLRDYVHEDGSQALHEFKVARRETLHRLGALASESWNRKARHAIFGPTTFLETVGFMADHDRMHAQQAWAIQNESAIRPAPPNH
jgi:FMN phosphatase YigB (HAD superfamily)